MHRAEARNRAKAQREQDMEQNMEQNFFSIYQKTGLYTLTTSYSSPPDPSSVPLAMEMAQKAGFKVYTLAPDRKDGYPTLATSLESLTDYRRMDEHFDGMPSKALVYVPMEVNNKVYASNGRRPFPCAGVFALKKYAKSGADMLVTYSLDGGFSDGNFSYVEGAPRPRRPPKEAQDGGPSDGKSSYVKGAPRPRRPPKEAQDGDELGERKRTIGDKVENALQSLECFISSEDMEALAKFARGPFIERLKSMQACSKITLWEIKILLYFRSTDLCVRNYRDCSDLFKNRAKRGISKGKSLLFLERRGETYEFKLNTGGADLLMVNKLPIDQQIRKALRSFNEHLSAKGVPIDIAKEGNQLRKRCYRAEMVLAPLEGGKVAKLVDAANDWWDRYCAARTSSEKALPNIGGWVVASHLTDADKEDAKEIVAEVLKLTKQRAPDSKYSDEAYKVYQAFYRSIVTNQETCIPDECLGRAKGLLEKAEADGMDVVIPGRLIQYRPQQTELRFAAAGSQPDGETTDIAELEQKVADLEKKAKTMRDRVDQARRKDLERREKEAKDIIRQGEEYLQKLGLEY